MAPCPRVIARSGKGRALRAISTIALVVVTLAPAPARAIEDDPRLWITGIGRVALPGDFFGMLFTQARFRDDSEDLERIVVNPSIGHPLGLGFTAAVGYDVHALRSPRVRVEHRTWEEIALRHGLPGERPAGEDIRFWHRVRLEQRYLEGEDGAANRLRHLVEANVPLFGWSWHGVVRNEAFFDLDAKREGPTEARFGETRLFLGFDRAFETGLGLEVGYQLQYVDRRRRENLAIHTASITLRYMP